MQKAHHAPKGGENIGGRVYRGGQFAPDMGPFGPITREFRHNAKGAVAHLLKQQHGEAIAALHHPEVGDVDLVWGEAGTKEKDFEDGYGLAKIAAKHPEILQHIQEHLTGMTVTKRSKNRIVLENTTHRALVRIDWDGQEKTWLLTEYEKKRASGSARTGTAPVGG